MGTPEPTGTQVIAALVTDLFTLLFTAWLVMACAPSIGVALGASWLAPSYVNTVLSLIGLRAAVTYIGSRPSK